MKTDIRQTQTPATETILVAADGSAVSRPGDGCGRSDPGRHRRGPRPAGGVLAGAGARRRRTSDCLVGLPSTTVRRLTAPLPAVCTFRGNVSRRRAPRDGTPSIELEEAGCEIRSPVVRRTARGGAATIQHKETENEHGQLVDGTVARRRTASGGGRVADNGMPGDFSAGTECARRRCEALRAARPGRVGTRRR